MSDSGSRLAFMMIRVSCTDLRDDWMTPVCRDRFTMEVRMGSRAGRQDLNTEGMTGSSAHGLIGDPLMSSSMSA